VTSYPTATITGTNRRAVLEAARLAVRRGAWWHKGAVRMVESVVVGDTGVWRLKVEYVVTLDRRERRRAIDAWKALLT
jgi:hypothetical protein